MDKLLLDLFLPKVSTAGIIEFHRSPERWSDSSFVKACYQKVGTPIARKTDLNKECIEYIVRTISGKAILDAGAGLGHLTSLLSLNESNQVTALEFKVSTQLQKLESHNIKICQGSIENSLPFKDSQFDVVICTHVLEHIVNLKAAINELRRISKERLVIVVPLQTPSRYTPDLHMRYFMYPKNFLVETLPCNGQSHWKVLGGDLLYEEYFD
ncbi:class I SAM-dependent methyltransferase [Synechococcus sp. UW140]|uniref:class I SAM-dependent methyltransferase n=1 Tax=Synechococcus sp. UW140 TaxID=368503 RepID=UPI00313794C7